MIFINYAITQQGAKYESKKAYLPVFPNCGPFLNSSEVH
jgi:hypothetical protein